VPADPRLTGKYITAAVRRSASIAESAFRPHPGGTDFRARRSGSGSTRGRDGKVWQHGCGEPSDKDARSEALALVRGCLRLGPGGEHVPRDGARPAASAPSEPADHPEPVSPFDRPAAAARFIEQQYTDYRASQAHRAAAPGLPGRFRAAAGAERSKKPAGPTLHLAIAGSA
jgi:hypothetical protein